LGSPGKNVYFALLIFYISALVAAGLWPFDFGNKRPNRVYRNSTGNGIVFDEGIVLTGSAPRKLFSSIVASNAFTVEVSVKAARLNQTGPARIVSYSAGVRSRNFTLAQEGASLLFRLRTTRSNLNGEPSIRSENLFSPTKTQHIAASFNGETVKLYVNGRKVKEVKRPYADLSNWNESHYLVVGNEITGNRPWSGEINYLAIYSVALTDEEVLLRYEEARRSSGGTGKPREGMVAMYDFGME